MSVRLRAFERPEGLLAMQLQIAKIPFTPQFTPLPPRKWRWDVAFEQSRLLVDVQGGTWANGRHTRGYGYEQDCEKWNSATVAGWRILIVTTQQVEDGRALTWIEALLAQPLP